MTVSTGEFLKKTYDAVTALGDKVVVSDASLEIIGFEDLWVLAKTFPMPELSPRGEIEVPGPLGSANWQAQQLETNQQGAITLMETTAGHIDELTQALFTQGGKFEAKVYEGTPTRHNGYRLIREAFMQLDNPDRDTESRGEILMYSGTIFFHYFGEKFPGNIS